MIRFGGVDKVFVDRNIMYKMVGDKFVKHEREGNSANYFSNGEVTDYAVLKEIGGEEVCLRVREGKPEVVISAYFTKNISLLTKVPIIKGESWLPEMETIKVAEAIHRDMQKAGWAE